MKSFGLTLPVAGTINLSNIVLLILVILGILILCKFLNFLGKLLIIILGFLIAFYIFSKFSGGSIKVPQSIDISNTFNTINSYFKNIVSYIQGFIPYISKLIDAVPAN